MRILILLAFLMSGSVLGQISKSLEKEKIKEVILKETQAYEEGNMEKWKNTITQSKQMAYVFSLQNGTTKQVIGYENVAAMIAEWMGNKEDGAYETTERTNWNIKIVGDGAWAIFKEHALIDGKPVILEEIRFLEKIAGEWKLDLVSFIY